MSAQKRGALSVGIGLILWGFLASAVVLALPQEPAVVSPSSPQENTEIRVRLELYDEPVITVYHRVLAETGDPIKAMQAAVAQLVSIQSVQTALVDQLTEPPISAIIVNVSFLTTNKILIRVDQSQLEAIRVLPAVKALYIEPLTEFQATIPELQGSHTPPPPGEGMEMPAPGEPPGR